MSSFHKHRQCSRDVHCAWPHTLKPFFLQNRYPKLTCLSERTHILILMNPDRLLSQDYSHSHVHYRHRRALLIDHCMACKPKTIASLYIYFICSLFLGYASGVNVGRNTADSSLRKPEFRFLMTLLMWAMGDRNVNGVSIFQYRILDTHFPNWFQIGFFP